MRIAINTDNAAFDDGEGGAHECARILNGLEKRLNAEGLPAEGDSWVLFDINGNSVGVCTSATWTQGDGTG